MDPVDLIVQTIVASIQARWRDPFDAELHAAYAAMKDEMRLYCPAIDLHPLERRPHSTHGQGLLVEELHEFAAHQHREILRAILELAHLLRTREAQQAQVVGVDLSDVTAENLRISGIESSGVGVQITDSRVTQDIELTDPGSPRGKDSAGPDAVLTNVRAGRDITIRYGSDLPPGAVDELRIVYLERIFTLGNRLLLAPIAAQPGATAELQLNAVYVPPLVKKPNWLGESGQTQSTSTAAKRPTSRVWVPPGYDSALAQANRYKRLLLVGGPGSGKSSFVRHLALCMAGELLGKQSANVTTLQMIPEQLDADADETHADQEASFPQDQAWEHGGLLPLYIPLQDFAARDFVRGEAEATTDQLLKYVDKALEDAELEPFEPYLRRELRSNGGILLIDGLDEIPETDGQRAWVHEAIADFALSYEKVRLVITSRTYAVPNRRVGLKNFQRVSLAPFNLMQIGCCIRRIYPLLRTQPPGGQQQIEISVHHLQQAVRHNSSLRELAQTPLLLTLMVSLFAWRGGSLPERREELYARGVELLLKSWEQPKARSQSAATPNAEQVDVQTRLQFPHQQIRAALEELAYRSHRLQPNLDGAAAISEEALLIALIKATEGDKLVHPLFLADYLRHRSGILVDRGDGSYSFPHRTIQEYMAACYLHRRDDFPRELITLLRADPRRWREVLLFAAAKEARKRSYAASALIHRICPQTLAVERGAAEKALDALMVMLSGRLLVETGLMKEARDDYEIQICHRVVKLLSQVVSESRLPLEDRVAAGHDLGTLGDRRSGVGLRPDDLPQIDWQRVEAGPFLMGVNRFTCLAIRRPFEISRFPVTVAQYREFVSAGGYRQPQYWTRAGWRWRQENEAEEPERYSLFPNAPNQPQVGVSWYEAIAFCRWLSEQLGQKVSLPSEPQWERAARGTDGRTFPWGEEFGVTDCNMRWAGIGHPSPVGIFPQNASPCGASDMAGNVWEWCRTVWQSSLSADAKELRNDIRGSDRRVLRGGSWANQRRFVRCAYRHRNHPDHRGPNVGFRVVRE